MAAHQSKVGKISHFLGKIYASGEIFFEKKLVLSIKMLK